jgi:hypothetical protein
VALLAPVMKKNVPPAHFGYMATGVDAGRGIIA